MTECLVIFLIQEDLHAITLKVMLSDTEDDTGSLLSDSGMGHWIPASLNQAGFSACI